LEQLDLSLTKLIRFQEEEEEEEEGKETEQIASSNTCGDCGGPIPPSPCFVIPLE